MSLITGLEKTGWIKPGFDPAFISDIMKAYSAFHGLHTVEDVESHLELPRFCNLPDVMPLTEDTRICKWPSNKITWSILDPIPGVSLSEMETTFGTAFEGWHKVCSLRATYRNGDESANIVITHRRIDGPLGVLAESELPCGSNPRQCKQWYDESDRWSLRLKPSKGYTSLIITGMHELGHAIGISHIGKGNLMQPMYDINMVEPQAGDVAEAQARYPGDQPPPAPAARQIILIYETIEAGSTYKLTKAA